MARTSKAGTPIPQIAEFRAARRIHNIPQSDIAVRLERTQAWLSQVELGHLIPSERELDSLWRALREVLNGPS